MHLFLVTFILLQCLAAEVFAEEQYYKVMKVVVDGPYMEMRTGPGRGYPVFHVVDRGKEVSVIKRRTDWFMVQTERGKEGWVKRADMELTLTLDGEVPVPACRSRFWEFLASTLGGGCDVR